MYFKQLVVASHRVRGILRRLDAHHVPWAAAPYPFVDDAWRILAAGITGEQDEMHLGGATAKAADEQLAATDGERCSPSWHNLRQRWRAASTPSLPGRRQAVTVSDT